MTSWITICDTCKREGWTEDRNGGQNASQTDGEKLAALIEARADGVRTRRVSCLMGCGHGCNVAIQAEGKLCYTLGRFAPDTEAAEAIVAWARLHGESDTGQVPYRSWPAAIKGHFVTRHPPLPKTE